MKVDQDNVVRFEPTLVGLENLAAMLGTCIRALSRTWTETVSFLGESLTLKKEGSIVKKSKGSSE